MSSTAEICEIGHPSGYINIFACSLFAAREMAIKTSLSIT
jgi:hypothetical protein